MVTILVVLDLSGVNARIVRAHEHLKTLDAEMRGWADSHPYGLFGESDDQGRTYVFHLEVYREHDAMRWGLLISDCLHTLRAALDNLVVAVARFEQKTETVAAQESKLQFPICDTTALWDAALKRDQLYGISDRARAVFARYQPHIVGHGAKKTVLAVLRDLNDIDKHRVLHTTSTFIVPEDGYAFTPPLPPGSTVRPERGPLVRGAKVVTVTLPEPRPPFDVYAAFGVRVSVDQAPVPEDARILVDKIAQVVQRIVADTARTLHQPL